MTGVAETFYKGYIWLVDNPAVVESLLESLRGYGVPKDNITIGNDTRSFINSLKRGDTVVVNSLFDLSPKLSDIIIILSAAAGRGVRIISLRENREVLSQSSAELLQLLGSYAELSGRTSRPSLPTSRASASKYQKALKFYRSGMSMQKAASAAGCNYSSFWYWYRKTIKQ